ncbi:ribosome biogenesis GTP-binding protein YlqF [Ammonifex degensii KC4]|uniref:Ribosome biogenesis GTPase A n=1 Tax=Ammonifex degensii (strain DSM 10501 / KC4) TaxID=429009 RepID=C9R881_AMMDK|nr:ribosome biogenesis GTPase YlqF [Ammonifex degensii]ACX52510.1 ribosome biogenesis GTP-binding protein YlqF [Ammonifex degensii KC4]
MSLHWYPGHMVKARRLLRAHLPLVQVVFELLDARIPYSSRNPDIAELLAGKPRVVVLNKEDLADPQATRAWLAYLEREGHPALAVNSLTGKGLNKLEEALRRVAKPGRTGILRGMVVGIPNVGKSSFINRLVRGRAAAVGAKPGVTKGKQWIKVTPNFELLDTPGVLWPRFEDPEVGLKLAVTGALKEEVIDVEAAALWLAFWLQEHYPDALAKRYPFAAGKAPEEFLEELGRYRGFFLEGGCVDRVKAAVALLKDFREGRLGRFTLDPVA